MHKLIKKGFLLLASYICPPRPSAIKTPIEPQKAITPMKIPLVKVHLIKLLYTIVTLMRTTTPIRTPIDTKVMVNSMGCGSAAVYTRSPDGIRYMKSAMSMIVIAWDKARRGQLLVLSKMYPRVSAKTNVDRLLIRKHSDNLFETWSCDSVSSLYNCLNSKGPYCK